MPGPYEKKSNFLFMSCRGKRVKGSHALYAGAFTMLLVGYIKVFETLFYLRAAFQLNGVLLTGRPFF